MSLSESLSYLSLAEREFTAGEANIAGGKLRIKQCQLLAGREVDDIRDELKGALPATRPLLVQASATLSLLPLKGADLKDVDAIKSAAAKAAGIDAGDARLAVFDAQTGKLATPGSKGELLAACFSKQMLQAWREQLSKMGVQDAQLYCRALNVLAALRASLGSGAISQPVLFLDILPDVTRLYIASKGELADLGTIDSGSAAMLEQVMAALGLKFPGSAAKLFYGDVYDFDEHAAKLVAPLAEKVRGRLGSSKGKAPAPGLVYASGIPSSRRNLLGKHLAEALSLQNLDLAPDYTAEGATVPDYLPSASLGLFNLITGGGEAAFQVDLNSAEQDVSAVLAAGSAPAATPAKKEAAKPEAPKPAEPKKPEAPEKANPPAAAEPEKKGPTPPAKKSFKKPQQRGNQRLQRPNQKPAPEKAADKGIAAAAAPAAASVSSTASAGTARPLDTGSEKKKGKGPLIGGIIGALVVVGVAVFFVVGGSKEAEQPKQLTPSTAAVPAEPESTPAEVSETEALPADVDGPEATPAPDTLLATEDSQETAVDQAMDGQPVEEEPVVVEELPPPDPVGDIEISSTPSEAEVYVDGEYRGRTPLSLYEIPAGQHSIEFRKEGFVSRTEQVDVVDQETASLSGITLELQTGDLRVATDPEGVAYRIEALSQNAGRIDASKLRGETPATVEDLLPGDYVIHFQRDGWPEYSTEVTVDAGGTVRGEFTYVPGSVNVTTSPEGARIIIDGESAGQTPADLSGLSVGTHEISVELDGYESESSTVDIESGETATASFELLSVDRLITRPDELDQVPEPLNGTTLYLSKHVLKDRRGTAYVRMIIDTDGNPSNIEVINSDIPEADDAIKEAIRDWQFTPGVRKGHVMRTVMAISVRLAPEPRS